MLVRKVIASILFLLITVISYAQTFTYSYVDPCTGIKKSLQVPSNGVTVTYYNQVHTFQPTDFYNGAFDSWAQTVYSSFGSNNPCASIVGLPSAITVAQGSALSFISIVNSLSALQDFAGSGSTNMLGGVESMKNSENKDKKKQSTGEQSSDKSSNTGSTTGESSKGSPVAGAPTGSQTSGSTQTTGSTSSNPSTSGSQTTGSSSTGSTTGSQSGSSTAGTTGGQSSTTQPQSTGSSTGSTGESQNSSGSAGQTASENAVKSEVKVLNNVQTGNGSGSTDKKDPATDPNAEGSKTSTNLVGGAVVSVQNAQTKNGSKPTVVGVSDFIGFNFKNNDVSYGAKATGGYTSMRWDGQRSHGILVDYTTALKGPNITGFYAYLRKRRIDLISTTLTVGFDVRPSVYGTLALGQMWNIDKKKKLKAVYMLTGSFGSVYGQSFIGTAAIAGGMYDWKVSKRIDVKLMGLYVYAPYVSYYNDILLKSPHVVLPIIGTNIGITKRFKLNINGGGAWALQEATLNYTVMMGTRILIQ